MKLFFKKILGLSLLCMSSYALALTDQVQCEQNGINYQAAQILIKKLQQAIAADEKDEVAKLASYPVRVNQGSSTTSLKNAKELSARYEVLFNNNVKEKMKMVNPKKIFCNGQGAMIADGVFWLKTDKKPGFFVINVF